MPQQCSDDHVWLGVLLSNTKHAAIIRGRKLLKIGATRRATLSFSPTFNPSLSVSLPLFPQFCSSPLSLRFLACFRRLTCKQNKSSFGRRVEGMAREKLAGNVSKGSVRLFSFNQNHPLRHVSSTLHPHPSRVIYHTCVA